MTYFDAREPHCTESEGAIELTIQPRLRDLGEVTVRRVLPAPDRRMVGPFIFFDHMGPAEFPPGKGIAVRPHPHIGLATISYLFEGQMMHRDSLGYTQLIEPGAVNLMTAGKGIVHSERAGDDLAMTSMLHGIQSWMALPVEQEEIAAAFEHCPATKLPELAVDGAQVRVIMGAAFGSESPVTLYSPTLYLDCRVQAGAVLDLPDSYEELAFYVVSGGVRVDGSVYDAGTMAVACSGRQVVLRAESDSRVMVIGGAPLGKRHIWWNFVSSSKDRIEQAKSDWRENRFGSVPGETEFIPLPE